VTRPDGAPQAATAIDTDSDAFLQETLV
jgi:hypothetical protein